ncbi:transposase [Methylobacter sp. S3L5C]|uniref:transposase n=1 Tax=Methylobacter sp. S3L5C TaxID=2839024 RepID=UPI001FAB41B5|nr:transposase [Methylobacter sp. S3L5C]UOA08271.1 transposase [Methylobacter sp. S3L5C]
MNQEKKTVYSKNFRASSIKIALDSDQPLAQVARALGIKSTLLYTWINSYKQPMKPGTCRRTDNYLYDELKRLKNENSLLMEERDLLKKATAYFASKQ